MLVRASFVVAALLVAGCVEHALPPAGNVEVPAAPPEATPLARAEAAFAERAFERAAIGFGRAAPASGPDRWLAEQRMGVCYWELGLRRAGLSVLDGVMERGDAGLQAEAFRFLARAALVVETDAVGRSLARLPAEAREVELARSPKDVSARVRLLVGQQLRREAAYDAAAGELARVDGADAPDALLSLAVVHVLRRKSVPTADVLRKLRGLAAAMGDTPDARRLRDRASLFEAEVYYTAALRTDPATPKTIFVARTRLNEAMRLWATIDAKSPYYVDAQWGSAWGHYALGELDAALSGVALATAGPDVYFPDAEILAADVRWRMRKDKEALAAFQRFTETYEPVLEGLRRTAKELEGRRDAVDDIASLLERARTGAGSEPPALRRALRHALSDREVARSADEVRAVDAETAALSALSAELRGSEAGTRARIELGGLHARAASALRTLVVQRLTRAADELGALLEASRNAPAAAKSTATRR